MTDFKVGDRVRVEFEGKITDEEGDGTWRVQPESYNFDENVYVLPSRMTKLAPPLPTKEGTVIESHGFRFILTRYGWHATTDRLSYQPGVFEDSMFAKDFTVVLEG